MSFFIMHIRPPPTVVEPNAIYFICLLVDINIEPNLNLQTWELTGALA